MNQLQHILTLTATVIGYFVMAGWLVLIAWVISMAIGELRFSRALKRRAKRESDNLRSSWLLDERESTPVDGPERSDTLKLRSINFQFHPREDDFATEETGAVFDIRERYPDEFAQDRSDRPEVHH